nr:unnamed protein product [Pseudomonas sp.]
MDIAQRHDGVDLPIVSDGVRVVGESFEEMTDATGRKWCVLTPHADGTRYTVRRKQSRGSFDTSLVCRCDGQKVELSGNVGRYNRADNVWNYDLAETLQKASDYVAQEYGLPGFTAGECRVKPSLSKHDYDLGLWSEWTGAVFRELHVTRNYYVGSEALACEAMRYMGEQRASRVAKGKYGDETIVFGKQHGKLHKRLVVYRKAQEMLAHAKGDEAKKRVKASEEYQFARDMGLIRIECKWGRDFLRDNGLRFVGDANMAKVISIFERESGFLLNVSADRAARVVSEMPSKIRSSALHWIRGDDLRVLLPRATYFRHVKALREFGIDATEPRSKQEGAAETLQRLLDDLPQFELRELPAPDWYGLPDLSRRAA